MTSFTAFRLIALAALVLLSMSGRALAQAERQSVEIVTAASADEAKALEPVLRELIGHLPVTMTFAREAEVDPRAVITPRDGARPAIARVWVDVTEPRRATVYLVDGPWERVLVRHVPLRAGVDEVAREQIGHILSAAIDALLSGARIGLTREEAARSLLGDEYEPSAGAAGSGAASDSSGAEAAGSATADDAPANMYVWDAPRVTGAPLDLGLYYEMQAWSGEALFVHGPAAALYAAFREDRSSPGVWVEVEYRFPVVVDRPPIGVRLSSGAIRALATLDRPLGARSSLRFGLGAGVDVVGVEPRQLVAGDDVEVAAERSTLVPLARALGALRYRVLEDTTLTAAFALDVELFDARYTIERGDQEETVMDPWTLRPALLVGVATYLIPPP